MHRIYYAMTRVLVTRKDAGAADRFNTFRRSSATCWARQLVEPILSSPLNRSLEDTLQHFAINVLSDAGFNVLKEFWPDMRRKSPAQGVTRTHPISVQTRMIC